MKYSTFGKIDGSALDRILRDKVMAIGLRTVAASINISPSMLSRFLNRKTGMSSEKIESLKEAVK